MKSEGDKQLADWIRDNGPCDTTDIANFLDCEYNAAFVEKLFRVVRSIGIGQDEHGNWWHYSKNESVSSQVDSGIPEHIWPDDLERK